MRSGIIIIQAIFTVIIALLTLIMFREPRNVVSGGYARKKRGKVRDKKIILRNFISGNAPQLTRLITRDITAPVVRRSDIPERLPYKEGCSLTGVAHVGQLKLFLSEVQFLTECLALPDAKKFKQIFVVYPGSGPGHTRKVLAEMFPALKFILIDPQEHDIRGASPSDSLYLRVPKQTIQTGKSIHHATASGFIATEKGREVAPLSVQEMFAAIMREKDYTFYIIEDFMTNEIAREIRDFSEKMQVGILFISDIRTAIKPEGWTVTRDDDNEGVSDIDILVNGAWQHMWMNIIRPVFSMVKFRTPFHNPQDISVVERSLALPIVADTFRKYREMFGIDCAQEYHAGRYFFAQCAHINLQAFAGASSSETRMIIAGDHLRVPLALYDSKEHEEFMFFFNLMRKMCFIARNKAHFGAIPGFDGCLDCDLALHILDEYARLVAPSGRAGIDILRTLLARIDRTLLVDGHGFFTRPYRNLDDYERNVAII